jgi:NAD(P)-dependent dehydrogenase (short-subunit alcohol dehydrogenase family)
VASFNGFAVEPDRRLDLDEEIFQRLTNTEDHLTERKIKPHRDQCTEAMVAFANSAMPNKPGILYVGVNDIGKLARFLCSEAASYITETDTLIDGGWTAQ